MTSFKVITDLELLKMILFNRCRLAENDCWEWVGAKDTGGYGLLHRNNKTMKAHRVSYEVYKGRIPKGLVVRHSCDNPACINPDHLDIGTVADNVRDRELRGRRDVKGEQIGTSKLTSEQVLNIKASSESIDVLADKYGVHRSNISLIRAGKSWKHLNPPAVH